MPSRLLQRRLTESPGVTFDRLTDAGVDSHVKTCEMLTIQLWIESRPDGTDAPIASCFLKDDFRDYGQSVFDIDLTTPAGRGLLADLIGSFAARERTSAR